MFAKFKQNKEEESKKIFAEVISRFETPELCCLFLFCSLLFESIFEPVMRVHALFLIALAKLNFFL